MRNISKRLACALMALVIGWLPMQQATAGMIGTDSAVAAAQPSSNRERVQQVLSRADVKAELERLGVSPAAAADRAGLLSEAELQRLAGQLDSAPAGAIGGLIVIVLLAVIVWALVVR